jgi:penicillin-binding protein 2
MADHDDIVDSGERQFTRRSLLLAAAQAVGFSLIGWRLFDLQVLERGHYAPLAEENRINLQILAPRRGRILDGAGRPLADNEEMFRATVTPALVKNIRGVLSRLQRILPLTDMDIAEIIRRTRKQSRNVPTVIATDLDFDHIAKLNLFAPSLPGIGTEIAWRRRYHGGASIGHVVGFVGNVDRFAVNDAAVLRLPDMRVGKYGAEAGFESDLRGSGGTRKVEVDARGRVVRNLETVEPVHGRDVTLSIDGDLQQAIWKRLEKERLAAAVVLDVQTGEIVASNSVPGFDPASIAGGISEADWQKLTAADDKPLLNRAISGQYAPGSTFKIVTALAALGAGVVSPDEHVVCNGHYEFADRTYPCWKPSGHGDLTMHDAIRCSCDVFFFEMARRAGIAKIAETARRLGLGAVYDFGLTDEKAGVIPDPDWKRGNLNAAWLGSDTLLTGVGQGYVQATPLQLALMTARIAGGLGVVPSIKKSDAQSPKQNFAALSVNAAHLDVVRGGMIAAVNDEGGTGEKAKLGEGRPTVAGKTGTSQISMLTGETAEDNLERSKRDHALFVAYMPAKAPRYAMAAVIEHGGAGGMTAAPLARDILNLVLDRDDRARTGKDAAGDGAASHKNASETAG